MKKELHENTFDPLLREMSDILTYWIGCTEHDCNGTLPIGACLKCDMEKMRTLFVQVCVFQHSRLTETVGNQHDRIGEIMDALERQNKEVARLRSTVRKFVEDYDNIRWGPDGDCGATSLVNKLDCGINPTTFPEPLAVLNELVEIDRRDRLTDPDMIATDEHREKVWDRAIAIIAKAKGGQP